MQSLKADAREPSSRNGKRSRFRRIMARLRSSLEGNSDFIPSPDTSDFDYKIWQIRELNRVEKN